MRALITTIIIISIGISNALVAQDISYFKSFGGYDSEQGNAVVVLPNGHVATAMNLPMNGIIIPALLVTDEFGDKVFCKKFPAFSGPSQLGHIEPNADGYLLVGHSSGTFCIQTDTAGNVLWSKSLSVGNGMYVTDVLQVNDGYLMIGKMSSSSSSYAEIACLKTDMLGNVIWSKQLETDNYQLHDLKIIQHLGDLFIAGRGILETTFTDVFMMRLDSLANPIWTKHFNSTYDDELAAFILDDNDFYLIGRNYAIQSEWDVFLLKVNANGDLIDSKQFDGNIGDERTRCAVLLDNGTLAISFDHGGSGDRSPAVMALNTTDLSINWCKTYTYEPQFTNYVLDIASTSNNGLIMVGDMHVIGKIRDTYLLRTLPNGDAGCNTAAYEITEIQSSFSDSALFEVSITVAANTTELDVIAFDAPEVIAFTVCEHIPPVARFHADLSGGSDCDRACFTFTDSSSQDPDQWEWSFDGGIPATYEGQFPPEICWNLHGSHAVSLTVSSSSGSNATTESITIGEDCPPVIPNIFSPNNDNVNDGFVIRSLPADFLLTISNRWGQQIFRSGTANSVWNGKHHVTNAPVPDGVYFYELLDLVAAERYTGYVHVTR